MLATLNNERLLLRDLRNFSQGDPNVQNKRNFQKHVLIKTISTLGKVAIINIQLYKALLDINIQTKKDYSYFLKSERGVKEDLLIKWEKLSRVLNEHLKNRPVDTSFLTRGIVNKTSKIVEKVSVFSGQLKKELYADINVNFSQESLKDSSAKFKHLPQDVLNDLTSDEYLECL